MKPVMYHYVNEYDKNLPNFRYLDVGNFRKQIDFFGKEYGFVTKEEWRVFIKNGSLPDVGGKVILTFDDAIACHYNYVYPELLKRGLWGIFYVPTRPYITGLILDVHRIHLLCGANNGLDLLSVANQIITEDMIQFEKQLEFRNETYKDQINYTGISEFKRLLNYYIDYEHRSSVIDEIAKNLSYVFRTSNFYMTKSELKEMSSNGMIIGSHTNSHPVMSKLSYLEQEHELVTSFEFLDKLILQEQKTYCHPYGGFYSFNKDTIDILNKLEVAYSFNVDDREIEKTDWHSSKQHLPRFDCNLFPHGSAS